MLPATTPVSVVIAAHGVTPSLSMCVEAYASETRDGDEILVCVAGDAADARDLSERFPGVDLVSLPRASLTPSLWAAGLARVTNPVVRVTIASCVPALAWRARILDAHEDGAVAAGGAIGPGVDLRLRDWAVLFLRYRAASRRSRGARCRTCRAITPTTFGRRSSATRPSGRTGSGSGRSIAPSFARGPRSCSTPGSRRGTWAASRRAASCRSGSGTGSGSEGRESWGGPVGVGGF